MIKQSFSSFLDMMSSSGSILYCWKCLFVIKHRHTSKSMQITLQFCSNSMTRTKFSLLTYMMRIRWLLFCFKASRSLNCFSFVTERSPSPFDTSSSGSVKLWTHMIWLVLIVWFEFALRSALVSEQSLSQ